MIVSIIWFIVVTVAIVFGLPYVLDALLYYQEKRISIYAKEIELKRIRLEIAKEELELKRRRTPPRTVR